MHASSEPVIQPEWQAEPEPEQPSDLMRWLYQAQRFSLVRLHISVFALGSVALLCINLLAGSAGIWASTWIGAWAMLVVMHSVIAVIATLAIQLLADDEDVRPASEVSWEPAATWSAPPPAPLSPPPSEPAEPTASNPWHVTPPPPKEEERVSWKAASDVAWLNRPPDPNLNQRPDPPDARVDDTSSPGQRPS